jgi:hypothetical protein
LGVHAAGELAERGGVGGLPEIESDEASATSATQEVNRGLGKGFAPSASAAAAAMPGAKIRQESHPPGVAGTTFSLKEMAKYIRDGRNDPRMIGWAGRVLVKAGKPKSVTAQAQAILDEIRRVTMYLPDGVNTERVTAAPVSLCLDEHGLCLPAGDCDDRCVCFGSGTMALGIETMVVAQAYDGSGPNVRATHVICAILDPSTGWQRVDPSTDDFPVGKSYPATKEWWMDPITGTTASTPEGAMQPQANQEAMRGDFIGVGAVPRGPVVYGHPTGLGAVPFEHAFGAVDEGCEQGPADVTADLTHGDCRQRFPLYAPQPIGVGDIPVFPEWVRRGLYGTDDSSGVEPRHVRDGRRQACATSAVVPDASRSDGHGVAEVRRVLCPHQAYFTKGRHGPRGAALLWS